MPETETIRLKRCLIQTSPLFMRRAKTDGFADGAWHDLLHECPHGSSQRAIASFVKKEQFLTILQKEAAFVGVGSHTVGLRAQGFFHTTQYIASQTVSAS